MLDLIGNEIYISKGNTDTFKICLYDGGFPFETHSGDKVVVRIGNRTQEIECDDASSFVLWTLPADLPAGDYKYDISYVFGDTDEVQHLLYPTRYKVCEVVPNA